MNERQDLSTADIASAGAGHIDERAEDEEIRNQDRQTAAAVHQGNETQPAALFDPNEAQSLRSHWDQVQGSFVDDPRRAVQEADSLVAEVIKRLADTFAEERAKLEQQWGSGENVSTEDLRMALHRYRSFFDRLLSI